MEGFEVGVLRTSSTEADIFVTTTGNKDIIRRAHGADEGQAIVGNIGHFDNEIDMAELEAKDGSPENIKPQVDRWTSPTATASSSSPRAAC